MTIDHDSTGHSLQPVRAQFLNFLSGKLSRRNVNITRISNGHISVQMEATVTWSGKLVVLLRIVM